MKLPVGRYINIGFRNCRRYILGHGGKNGGGGRVRGSMVEGNPSKKKVVPWGHCDESRLFGREQATVGEKNVRKNKTKLAR